MHTSHQLLCCTVHYLARYPAVSLLIPNCQHFHMQLTIIFFTLTDILICYDIAWINMGMLPCMVCVFARTPGAYYNTCNVDNLFTVELLELSINWLICFNSKYLAIGHSSILEYTHNTQTLQQTNNRTNNKQPNNTNNKQPNNTIITKLT